MPVYLHWPLSNENDWASEAAQHAQVLTVKLDASGWIPRAPAVEET